MSLIVLISYQDNLLQFEFDDNANVGDLKRKLEERTGLAPNRQSIMWNTGSDEDITDDIPLGAMGIEDVLMVVQKEAPPTISRPTQSVGGYNSYMSPQLTSQLGGGMQGDFFFQNHFGAIGDFEPFLDGRTRINTNPNAQFGIGSSVTSNDFLRLLDVCETDTEVFTHEYESKFGNIHPEFMGGSFTNFYQSQKFTQKPIIINIHAKHNTDSVFFCSLLLSNKDVVDAIKARGIQFWVGEISKENERVYQQIFRQPIKYPFLAIVGSVSGNFNVIEFINELCPKHEFVQKINKAATQLENEIERKKREQLARDAERKEREEQNKLFQKSQREDKMKDIQKQEDQQIALISSASKLCTLQETRRSALEAAEKLPAEPDAKSQPKPTRIMITLPDGTKKQRFFNANDSVQMIFTWVSGLIAERLTDETFLDDQSPALDAVGEAVIPWTISAYELACAYPKKNFTMAEAASTLLEVGIAPHGAALILQRI